MTCFSILFKNSPDKIFFVSQIPDAVVPCHDREPHSSSLSSAVALALIVTNILDYTHDCFL
jgi:hypothetical protein